MRDLSLHLMDIMQNSITAEAKKIFVGIKACKDKDRLEIEITDDGMGMDENLMKHVTDPFVTTRTTRKIGLGIPLLKASSERAGGVLAIKSVFGRGTTLEASFQIGNIDRIPLGSIEETFTSVITANLDTEFELFLSNGKEEFRFNSFEVKERLGDLSITNYEVIVWIKEYIQEGIKIIFGGVLDEVIG
jgi:signal transduction histidine kinase